MGLDTVPVVELSHLSEAQRKAYILADNRLALNAGWDWDAIKVEFEALTEDGFDISLIGFSEEELSGLFNTGTEGNTDPDDIPEGVEATTQPGDVWVLGRHRLVCGDCTDALVAEKAMNGVQPHLMVTDPPYGVEYDPAWRAEVGVNKNIGKMGQV